MASERPGFRPNRTRASLSAVASASSTLDNNENRLSTSTAAAPAVPPPGRKKRAQSLGGDALEQLRKRTKLDALRAEATINFELSPNKHERRRAAPRRSILKQVGVVFDPPANHTTDLSALSAFERKPTTATRRRSSIKPLADPVEQYDDSDDDDDDPNGSLDMEITRMDITVAYDGQGRRVHRASHSRRVSFAPSANVRHFTPDKPTAEAQNAQAAREAAERAALELAERTGDTSYLSNTSGVSVDDLSGSDEDDQENDEDEDDALESEPSMEIAGDEVTLAFRGHFAGTQLPISALQPEVDPEEDNRFNGEVGTAGHERGIATQPLGALDGTEPASVSAAASASQAPSTMGSATDRPHRPRFSTIVRQEDDEDEEIMRSLGFAKGGKPRKSRIGTVRLDVPSADEGDSASEEGEDGSDMDEDGTQAMDMTTAVGGIIQQQGHAVESSEHLEDEDEDEDDEAESAEVSMQLIGNTSVNPDGANDVDDSDMTADMVEATASYGSILSAPLPRPSLATRPEPHNSPVRARTASPPKSPADAAAREAMQSPVGVRAQSVPPLGGNAATVLGTPSKSPFRRSGGYGTPTSARRMSPLPSPRRILAPLPSDSSARTLSPAPPPGRARSRSASPVKQTPFLPPSSLAGKSTHKSAQTPPPPPPSARDGQTRGSIPSPVKSIPSKAPTSSNPSSARPPPRHSLAAGRSPGGSLSLKGLMVAQQQQQRTTASHSAHDPQQQHEEERDSNVQIDGPRAEPGLERDPNLTASEFESSFDATPDGPRAPASIEEFFAATGTEFVSDFVSRSGAFDLSSSRARRKSLAASAFGDDSKDRAPPTFADKVVAGACQLLMHDLYRNDQRLLLERLQETQAEYNEIDEYVHSGEIPPVFRDWALASDEEKISLKNRFAQIKLHHLVAGAVDWKTTRNENMQQIINAMEQRLDELRHDRAELEQFELESVLPSLEERYATLQAELDQERLLDQELSSYSADQREELAQLQADIDEQEEQINGNRTKGIPGARPQFERVEQQLQKDRAVLEGEVEKELAAKERIAELEGALKDKRTKADLTRMKAEFETLQQVHGWTLVRFDSESIRLKRLDDIEVLLSLDRSPRGLNVIDIDVRIVATKKWASTLAHDVTEYLVGRISDHVAEELRAGHDDARSLVHVVSNQLVVLRQIRHEVMVAALSYPIHFSPTTRTLELEVYARNGRKAFLVSLPLSDIELGGSIHPAPHHQHHQHRSGDVYRSKWAEHVSVDIQVKFGGHIGSAGLVINERLNDCEGLVAALRAGEEACNLVAV